MFVFVLCGMLTGMIASLFAVFAGASLFTCFTIYALTGVAFLLLVVLRGFICESLKKTPSFQGENPKCA